MIAATKRAFSSPLGHASVLALLALATRLPFRSSVLYTWDAVNYALGILDFDVIQHRPHPPGYILYVAMGKAITRLTDDPNASLVWLSVVASVLTVLSTYAYARRRFSPGDALVSAVLLLTSPLFWFYSEVALTYSVEAFFTIVIAYTCYRALDGPAHWAYVGALLLGLAGGVRQTTLLIMLPLVLYTAMHLEWRHRLGMIGVMAATCLAWGLPLVMSTGGLAAYLSASSRLSSIVEPKPLLSVVTGLFYGLHLALPLFVCYLLRLFPVQNDASLSFERWFLILWIAPGLLVVTLWHIGQSGYLLFLLPPAFIYLPALLRGALEQMTKRRPMAGAGSSNPLKSQYLLGIVAMLLVGPAAFLLGTSPLIQVQETHWEFVQTLAERYPPDETIVLTDLSWHSGFRLASYYLREYHVYGFAVQEAAGPFKVADPLFVPGWIFHSYQLEDNYNLDPEQHQFNTILDLPSGIRGLIVTHPALLPHAKKASAGGSPEEPSVQILSDRLLYVALPNDARQLAVVDGRLEVR